MDIQAVLSSEFQTAPAIIGKIVSLIDEGNTIPFIARYRKEMTGAMDDQKLREISERLDYLRGLDKRREQIAASIAEQGKMTAELEKKLSAAATLSELEDIYRPYKQKRRTRAMIAKEKGVQPLADLIFAQRRGDDPLALAQAYVSEEKGVPDAETAVQLAQDILAEQISDDAAIRANLRALYRRTGVLRSVAAKEGESVYAQYADYREPVLRAAVTLEDGQGREIWRVRTMIHIAADRLEWLCAQELPDGSFALGGRYLTGDGAVQEQAATMAVIGPEGVLREIVPIQSGEEDMPVGCVRDMVYDPQRGLLLLTARGGQTKNGVCDIQTADGSFDVYVHVGFEAEDARLTLDDSGYAYVCGTDRDNGQNITAVVRVDLDAGEAPVKR